MEGEGRERCRILMLTPEQFEQIRGIVNRYHQAVIYAFCGESALPREVVEALRVAGIPLWEVTSVLEQAYLFGVMLSTMPDPGEVKTSYAAFKDRLEHRRFLPLSQEESAAVRRALKGAQYVKGLGNRIDEQTGQVLIEVDQAQRARTEEVIREETAAAIQRRQTGQTLRSRLGQATGEWTRDLHRIAVTEMMNAVQEGRADVIAKEYGEDALVFKRPHPDACEACKAAYLTEDGKPRIFRLSEIRNVTNAVDPARPGKRRRRRAWIPTAEVLHPHCRCDLEFIPPGWTFDEQGRMVPREGIEL